MIVRDSSVDFKATLATSGGYQSDVGGSEL